MAVLETPSVFIDDFYVTPNICHFLFDKMPRVAIAEPEFGKREALLFREFQYARDVLDLLGTNMTALAATKARGTVRLRDVVVYSSSFAQIGHPAMLGSAGHLAALDALRTRILDLARLSKSRMPRRFMLNRAPGLPRNITNRDEVLAVMARHDVLVGDPTILPARKQLVLFANVDLLIGVHGAGLTNLAYQPKGARVVELLPPLCATRAYWIMAGGLGQRYDAITCHDPERGAVDSTKLKHDVSLNRRDVVVPIDALEATLSA
jgi:capsular polysaccharide biosynthesis protein